MAEEILLNGSLTWNRGRNPRNFASRFYSWTSCEQGQYTWGIGRSEGVCCGSAEGERDGPGVGTSVGDPERVTGTLRCREIGGM